MESININLDGNVSLACTNPDAILHITHQNTEMIRVFSEYQLLDSETKRNLLKALSDWTKSEEAQLEIMDELRENGLQSNKQKD